MAILNYTTTIEAEQTIGEIQKILSRHNVMAMKTDYESGEVSAVSFQLKVNDKPMGFRLPCNWRAVRQVFDDQGITSSRIRVKDKNLDRQAIRTAWRASPTW